MRKEIEKLSKEEIKSHIDLVKLPQYKANSTEKVLVEYIEQLESDKQKVINKLEINIKTIEEDDKFNGEDVRRFLVSISKDLKGVENENI